MPPPTGTIELRTDSTVTQVGLVAESGSNPILINSVVAQASMAVDTLEDKYGDIFAKAWGNRRLVYDVELDQLAQYGISDNYLGRIDATLLANLTLNFGMGPDSGTALMTSGERRRVPARIPKVSLTIEVEDTRNAGLGSPDGASTPSYGSTPGGTRPTITLAGSQVGTIGSVLLITITATGTVLLAVQVSGDATLPGTTAAGQAALTMFATGSATTPRVRA
jgi:hypothetical protein